MSRLMLMAGAIAIGAVYASGKADVLVQTMENQSQVELERTPSEVIAETTSYGPSGSEVLKANARGHFLADFRVNGRTVHGLVDTGATFVAMNETTARKIGVSISGLDYKYAVSTANGKTEAAHVQLSKMELGSIRVRNVDAYVLKDRSLGETILVGMSFMRQLKSFEVEGDELRLNN